MEQPQAWLSDPDRLAHIIASAVVFFIFIVVLTRISGKRTTANMNNFDWIITVGIGSIMASGILLRNVSILDSAVAVCTLAAMQWLATWGTRKSKHFAQLVKPKPTLLLHKGAMLQGAMESERVTQDELKSALRAAGLSRRKDAAWIVIETSGDFSVIPQRGQSLEEADLLDGVAFARSARRGAWHTRREKP